MINRYGVVNVVAREMYEKKWNLPWKYDFITFNKVEAVIECRKHNSSSFIVERIFDSNGIKNKKEEIFRSGKDEKNN